MGSENRVLQLTVSPLDEDSCTVTALEGREQLNGLFEFDITVVAEEDPIDPYEVIGQDFCLKITQVDLERAIGTLPQGARDVFVLCAVNGYSYEETSSFLGVAVGTCKAQLHRARRLLKERLDQ